MKILIVEDDALIAMHLEHLLIESGHAVCAIARDADLAVEQGQFHKPDVVLMDLRLARGTSGSDAARRLHKCHRIRCIFISGNIDQAARCELAPFEPIDFIDKPINPFHLRRALSKVRH